MLPPADLNNDSNKLLQHVYGTFDNEANRQHHHIIERAIFTPKNKDVDAINNHTVLSFPGGEKVYLSADKVAQDEHADNYPMELLNSLNPPGFAPHQLRLKLGIPVILLGNINPGAWPTGHAWSSCTSAPASSRPRSSQEAMSALWSACRASTWTRTRRPGACPSYCAEDNTQSTRPSH